MEDYEKAAKVMGGAADTLETHGWIQRANIGPGGICMSQAMLLRIGTRTPELLRNDMILLCSKIMFEKEMPARPTRDIEHWNDQLQRTKEEVIAKLRTGQKEALRLAQEQELFGDR